VTVPRQRWKARVLAAVLAPLIAFILFELILRVTLFSPLIGRHPCSPGWNHPQYLVMPDDKAGYRLRPYFQGTEINPYGDFAVPVTVNSLGLRDQALAGAVCGDCYRVLVGGDSFAYGEGVRWEDTFAARMEAGLNRVRQTQVLNAGVPAYSLRQTFERLQADFDQIKPDLVIVTWVPQLITREYENSEMVYLKGYLVQPAQAPNMKVVGDNLFLSSSPPGSSSARLDLWLQSHSLAYFYGRHTLRLRILHALATHPLKTPRPFNLPPEYLLKPLETVAQMNQYCRDRRSAFLLVLLGSSPDLTREIARQCQQQNIAMISLAELVFELDSPLRKDFTFPHDDHFNALAHQYLADQLVPLIARRMNPSPP